MPETRAQAARKALNTSSALIDPPTDVMEVIQRGLRQRHPVNEDEYEAASDIEMNDDINGKKC